jgi:hypothetical protein
LLDHYTGDRVVIVLSRKVISPEEIREPKNGIKAS